MAERRIAHSFDYDGVMGWRIPVQSDVFPWKDNRIVLPNELPILNRETDERPLDQLALSNYWFHAMRGVTEQAAWAVVSIPENEDIYLNTGRKNRRPYVDLTERTLRRRGIRHRFKDLFFGERGVASIISKIVWLDQLSQLYDLVYHYDDNPKTSLTVEQFFRERRPDQGAVKSVIISDRSTSYLTRNVDFENRPNLMVARNIGEAVRMARS